MLVWNEELSIHDPLIDAQHQMFIDKINEFAKAGENGTSQEILIEMVQFLHDYARRHFFDEESLMKLHEYPDLEEHALVHMKFVVKVETLQEQIKSEGITPKVVEATSQFMGEWLINHIQKMDKAIGVFIETR